MFAQMEFSTSLAFNFSNETLLDWGAVIGSRAFNGEAWRLLTAIVMNTGVRQLVGNMCLLFLVAPFLISAMGTIPTAVIFVACGGIANIAAAMTDPNAVFVGASGAVFGLYGALVSVFFAGRFARHSIADQKQLKFAIWLSVPLSLMMSSLPDRVSIAAYLSGLFLGYLLGFSMTRKKKLTYYFLSALSVVAALSLILIVTLVMQGEQAKVLDIFATQLPEPPAVLSTYSNVLRELLGRALASK